MLELGASRNFEVWRDTASKEDAAATERAADDESNAMTALENRTLDSKLEMDVLDALDEIKVMQSNVMQYNVMQSNVW